MSLTLLLLVGLHLAAGVFWFFSALLLVRGASLAQARALFRPQMIAAALAVFSGGGLWQLLHAGAMARPEWILAAGAVCAIAAAGAQGGLVGGSLRRAAAGVIGEAEAGRRIALGHRIAAALLAAAILTMVGERFA